MDNTTNNDIEIGIEQVYKETRGSLELILRSQEFLPSREWDRIAKDILTDLDDAIANNWDELVSSFRRVTDPLHVEDSAEWADINSFTDFVAPGRVVDGDGNKNDKYAIVSGDGYVVIEGTAEDWRDFADKILSMFVYNT